MADFIALHATCRTCGGTGIQPAHTHTVRCLDPVRRDIDCDVEDLWAIIREGQRKQALLDEACQPDVRFSAMRWLCYLVGHDWAVWVDNGGRRVCERCNGRYCR